MREATFVVIAGLFFDIIGGIIIVGPLLFLVKRLYGGKVPETEVLDIDEYTKEQVKGQKTARIGIGFLIFGFILQL